MNPILKVENVVKSYSDTFQLKIDNLEINPNEKVALVGHNGSGKSTLLKILMDLVLLDSGFVLSKDTIITSNDSWKKYTASYLDEKCLIPYISPKEYFELLLSIYGIKEYQFPKEILEFGTSIIFESNKPISQLSKGNKAKTGIIGALITSPEVLILDEPFANLDEGSKEQLLSILLSENYKNTSIIAAIHDNLISNKFSTKTIRLDNGRLV